MKDIFVDNNVASKFSNPVEDSYKRFIKWLLETGSLAVSQKLLIEYKEMCSCSREGTNIEHIVAHLLREGRLNKISAQELELLRFSKKQERKLRSNFRDHVHIKTVLLSNRKLAISLDTDFRYDVANFPGHNAQAASAPDDLSYQ